MVIGLCKSDKADSKSKVMGSEALSKKIWITEQVYTVYTDIWKTYQVGPIFIGTGGPHVFFGKLSKSEGACQ